MQRLLSQNPAKARLTEKFTKCAYQLQAVRADSQAI
jgi:hypothetical protein